MNDTIQTSAPTTTTTSLRNLVRLARHVCVLVDDARLTIRDGKARLLATDPAHVAMVELHAHWSFEGSGDFDIEFDHLNDKCFATIADEAAEAPVTVAFTPHTDETTRDGRIRITAPNWHWQDCLASDCMVPSVPRLTLPLQFTALASELQAAMLLSSLVSDHIKLTLSGADAPLIEAGTDGPTTSYRVATAAGTTAGSGSAKFSGDYLKNIVDSFPPNLRLRVRFNNDMPIEVQGVDDDFSVTYLIAPRIES